MSSGGSELVVFMLHVNLSERGFTSSACPADALPTLGEWC